MCNINTNMNMATNVNINNRRNINTNANANSSNSNNNVNANTNSVVNRQIKGVEYKKSMDSKYDRQYSKSIGKLNRNSVSSALIMNMNMSINSSNNTDKLRNNAKINKK